MLPDALARGETASFAEADLVFLVEGLAMPKDAAPRARLICLTEKPEPTGYRVVDDRVRVSVNPISWRGLGAACPAALSGRPPSPSRAAGAPAAGGAPPDRGRAIAGGRRGPG